jgi:hypothetical protein
LSRAERPETQDPKTGLYRRIGQRFHSRGIELGGDVLRSSPWARKAPCQTGNESVGRPISANVGISGARGSAPEVQDLVARQIDLCFDTPVLLPLVRAGSITAYAVTGTIRVIGRVG